jgi:FkbM family methyltransferase
MIESAGPEVVVDVGANQGEYIRDGRSAGFTGRIVVVEPIPELARRLAAEGLLVHPVAASDHDGTTEFVVTQDSHFSGVRPPNALAGRIFAGTSYATGIKGDRRITVGTRRLNGLLAAGAGRFFVKLDTQGHDLHALRGLESGLERVVVIQTELALQHIYDETPTVGDHVDALAERGFAPAAREPIFRSDDLAIVEADGYFVRRA